MEENAMKTLTILLFVIISEYCFSQVTKVYNVTLATPGTIMNYVDYNTIDSVSDLTVSGVLNNSDLKSIKRMVNLKRLNLANAIIKSDPVNNYLKIYAQDIYTSYLNDKFYAAHLGIESSPNAREIQDSLYSANKENVSKLYNDGGVIVQGLFQSFKSLEYINLPKNIRIIEDEAFSNCSGLKEVVIPDEVVFIGNNAFYFCENLLEIKMPSSLYCIGYEAFNYCKSLTNVEFTSNINFIDRLCFFQCYSLINITILDIKALDLSFIGRCESLRTIHCNSKVPPSFRTYGNYYKGYFDRKDVIFYFPKESVTDYIASPWADFFTLKMEQ
jgi:hypothetical protein